jgi:hypothetical protein
VFIDTLNGIEHERRRTRVEGTPLQSEDRDWRQSSRGRRRGWRKTALDIDAAEVKAGPGERLDLLPVTLIVLLGTALLVYLAYTVFSH